MKLSIDIECTPEEARAFFGMPAIDTLNRKLLEQMEARIVDYVRTMDADSLAKMWFPAGAKAWEQMANTFAASFAATDKNRTSKP